MATETTSAGAPPESPPVVGSAVADPNPKPVYKVVPPRGKSVLGGEPAILIGAVATVIVALAALFHVVLDVNTVTGIIVAAVPLITGVLTRFHVRPVVKSEV